MSHERQWIIIGATNPDPVSDSFDVVYWSIFVGWTEDLSLASICDDDTKELCSLPQGGQWLEIGSILK
jgi:hypothetical protein